MANTAQKGLGKPRQVRFPKDVEADLKTIAESNDLEWSDTVRMVARLGLPLLKKKLGDSIKAAA